MQVFVITKQRQNNDKRRCERKDLIEKGICERKDLIEKGICDKEFIWNQSNCECECDKSCDVGEYLHYASVEKTNW